MIATKAGARAGDGPLATGTSRRRLLAALDGSLNRLRTDHVDLWQVHTWHPDTPLEETLAALDYAVSSGRRATSGSPTTPAGRPPRPPLGSAARPGRAPLVSTQMEYSLLARGVEREVIPAAARRRDRAAALVAARPRGACRATTGRRGSRRRPATRAASPTWGRFVEPYLTDESTRVVEAVRTAAKGLGTSPVAVAIAWVRDRPAVTAPILGARTVAQLKGLLESEELTLPASIRSALDDVSAPEIGYPERLALGLRAWG